MHPSILMQCFLDRYSGGQYLEIDRERGGAEFGYRIRGVIATLVYTGNQLIVHFAIREEWYEARQKKDSAWVAVDPLSYIIELDEGRGYFHQGEDTEAGFLLTATFLPKVTLFFTRPS